MQYTKYTSETATNHFIFAHKKIVEIYMTLQKLPESDPDVT
jgi:hypothetical protein